MTSMIDPGKRDLAVTDMRSDKLPTVSVDDVDQLSLSEALLMAYLEATDECLEIGDPQPSMMKGIASVWGMGDLFGPHIVVDPFCREEDIGESLDGIWGNVGRYMWTAIDNRNSSRMFLR